MVIYPDMYPTSREVQGQIKIGIDGITALSPYGIYSAKRPLFDRKKKYSNIRSSSRASNNKVPDIFTS